MPCCTRGTQSQPTSRSHLFLMGWLACHTTLHPTPLHPTPLHPTPLHHTPLHPTPLHHTPLHPTALHPTPSHPTAQTTYIHYSHTTLHPTTVSEHCFLLHCTLILPPLPHPDKGPATNQRYPECRCPAQPRRLCDHRPHLPCGQHCQEQLSCPLPRFQWVDTKGIQFVW